MFSKLLLCLAAPAFLSATNLACATDVSRPYLLEYRLADPTGQVIQLGRTFLSKRNPTQSGTGFVRVGYISSCQPDSDIVTHAPTCETETMDLENTLQFAMDSATPDTVVLSAWVSRQTLDGMQTIEHVGFATQRPLWHGWSDSKTVKITNGGSATVSLPDQYTLTLKASMARQ